MKSRSPRCMASWYKRSYAMLWCSSSPRWTSWQFILNLDQFPEKKMVSTFLKAIGSQATVMKCQSVRTKIKLKKMEKGKSVDIYPKFSTRSSPSNNELVFQNFLMAPSEKLVTSKNQSNYLKCSTPSFHSSSSSSCNNRFSAKRCCFCFAAAWSCSQRGSFACWPSIRRPFWASTHRKEKWKATIFSRDHSTVLPQPKLYVFFFGVETL